MDAFCSICGHRWDTRDPGVRYIYSEGTWECTDEGLCFDRRALNSLEGDAARSPEYAKEGDRAQ